jgi:alkanesulfonate monooxygenase SsuD/methylene tetrahydromethanopterin reductase-like flavin-dependent oxidoreductase (luciferase family)
VGTRGLTDFGSALGMPGCWCGVGGRGRISEMKIDLLFDPFGVSWSDVRDAAQAAEGEGFDGVWVYDHLAGSVHRQDRVLESWTTLTAVAATVPRIDIGPMVLNVANRDAGTLGVMAATLQEISGGRLLLGLGAGGGSGTPYAAEQRAFGRTVGGDRTRREAVESAVSILRSVWTGTVGGVGGFLRPAPAPPIILGGFGPKVAALAGRVADGINVPGGPQVSTLLDTARAARVAAGRGDAPFVVTVSADLGARSLQRLEALDVDRVVVFLGTPSASRVCEVARSRP